MKKEYRLLSFVPRWGIAPRHHNQSVAEHSYYVALYSSQVCEMLDITMGDRTIVLDAALRHDATDVWESDIPGPAKRSIIDPARQAAYFAKFADSMDGLYRRSVQDKDRHVTGGHYYPNGADVMTVASTYEISSIIKVADLIDEVFFLAIEMQLGNNLVRGLYQKELSRLDQAAIYLAGDGFAEKLMQEVGHEIARLGEEGAVIPFNDEDLDKPVGSHRDDDPDPQKVYNQWHSTPAPDEDLDKTVKVGEIAPIPEGFKYESNLDLWSDGEWVWDMVRAQRGMPAFCSRKQFLSTGLVQIWFPKPAGIFGS